MTSTTVDLLTALGTHLSAFELPDIASVHLSVSLSGPPVTVQLSCGAPPVIAAGLLAWADTLTDITPQAWRVPRSDSVHLSVTGLMPAGVPVQVYGALPITTLSLGADLDPGTTTTLTLATLRHLATPGQITDEATL
jgi:hypothetical protein